MFWRLLAILALGTACLNLNSCSGGAQSAKSDGQGNTPDTFVIPSVQDAALNERYVSDVVVIAGIDAPIQLTVAGCRYQKNGVGGFSTEPSSVSAGDNLQFEVLAAQDYGIETTCTITLGDYVNQYSVRTINFYASAKFYFSVSGGGDDIVAVPESVYVHDTNAENMQPLLIADDGSIEIKNNDLRAFTAYFSRMVGENTYHYIYSNLSPSVDESFSMSAFERVEPDTGGCKSISFDTSGLNVVLEEAVKNTRNGLTSQNFCNRSLLSSQTSSSVVNGVFLQASEGAGLDDVMLFLTNDTRELLAYKLFNSADLVDQQVIAVADLDQDFLPLNLVNASAGEAQFEVFGYSEGVERPMYVARYTASPGETKADVNMLNRTFTKYRNRTQYNSDFFGINHFSQFVTYSTVRPESLTTDFNAGRVSYAEVSLDEGAFRLNWASEDISQYELADIRLSGSTENGERILWYAHAPNTGSVTLNPIPDIVGFDSSQGVSVSITFIRVLQDINGDQDYQRLTLSMTIDCFLGECKFVSN